MLSRRKWANFLPVGKDFTIPAGFFLPVGNGLQSLPAKVTQRHDGVDAGHNRDRAEVRPLGARWPPSRLAKRRAPLPAASGDALRSPAPIQVQSRPT